MDFLYVIIFAVVPILVLNYLSIKPQRRFIELYKEKVNQKDFLNPFEYVGRYRNKPLDQIKDAPKMFLSRLELFWKDYHDKELNKAARKVSLYFIGMTLVIIIDFFLFGFLLSF